MTITYYDKIDIRIPWPEDRPDVEETEPYYGVAPLDEREAPEPAKVFWTKVTEWEGLDLTPRIARNEEWRARQRAARPRYTGEFGDIDEPSDDGDRPTLDMGKVDPAVGSAIVWDDDEPSVGDVEGYGHPREK